jgi:hypothetical protein
MNLAARMVQAIASFLEKASPRLVALALAVAGVAGMWSMIAYNQTSSFCLKCHAPNGIFISFAEDSGPHTPYKKDRERCLTCHTDKDFYVVAGNWLRRAGGEFVHATNAEAARLPAADPGYRDEDCLQCHYDALKQDETAKLQLSPKVAEIGLRFSLRRHVWVKEFPAEAQARLAVLRATPAPTDEEQKELDFLRRAQYGWCGQCHDRTPPAADGRPQVDRTINYYSINPMSCTGCHPDAQRGQHPGERRLAVPSELTCRRCHTGTFHGRFATFRAECKAADKTDCRRCHPLWKPEDEPTAAALAPAAE